MSASIENKTNKLQIITLGGCVTHEIGKRLNEDYYYHKDHLWRRPTIALMSDPVDSYSFKTSLVPNRYVSYFINDVSGFHRNQLDTLDRESIILMDILRDVFTGVVEIGDGKYALNPVDGIGLLHDMTHETMSNKILSEILRTESPKTINPILNADEHFELWCKNIVKLADFLLKNFRAVVVPETYFITESLELHDGHSIDKNRSERINVILKRMYAFLRENTDLPIASIPHGRILTASEAPWGGPAPTHIIEETYSLYCAEIDRIIRKLDAPENFYLERAAFKRAQQHAHEQKHKLRAQKKIEELNSEMQALNESFNALKENLTQAQNDNLLLKSEIADHESELHRARHDLLKTQTDIINAREALSKSQSDVLQARTDAFLAQNEIIRAKNETLQLQSKLAGFALERDEIQERLKAQNSYIQKLKAELRQPLQHHAKRSLARATQKLRKVQK